MRWPTSSISRRSSGDCPLCFPALPQTKLTLSTLCQQQPRWTNHVLHNCCLPWAPGSSRPGPWMVQPQLESADSGLSCESCRQLECSAAAQRIPSHAEQSGAHQARCSGGTSASSGKHQSRLKNSKWIQMTEKSVRQGKVARRWGSKKKPAHRRPR